MVLIRQFVITKHDIDATLTQRRSNRTPRYSQPKHKGCAGILGHRDT
jgi:hypothetical protein